MQSTQRNDARIYTHNAGSPPTRRQTGGGGLPFSDSLPSEDRSLNMKFASILTIIATTALVSFDRTSAISTCSRADIQSILVLTAQIFSDPNCLAAMDDECPDAKCFATLEEVTKQMPSCVADGKNPRTTFEQLLKDCRASSVDGGSSTTTAPSITTATKTPSATTTTTTATPSATTATPSLVIATAAPSATTTAPSGIVISPNTGASAAAGRRHFSLSAGVVLSFAVVATALL